MMVVVDAQFTEPYTVDLVVQRKSAVANSSGNFIIIDVNGNMMFKIKDTLFSFHDRHILYDANDKPVLTFKKKLRSIHRRWQAFKGEGTTHKDLLFSVKKSSTPKNETELDVFLVENKEETECDCKVSGNWETRSCSIYAQDGSLLAEVHDKQNITNVVDGKDTFGITVYPEVDYVFIVALVVILNEIKSSEGRVKKIRKKRKKKTEKKSSKSSEEDNKIENQKIDGERNISEGIKELDVEHNEYVCEEDEDEEDDDNEHQHEEEGEEDEEEEEEEEDDDYIEEDEDDNNNESYDGEPIFDQYDDEDDVVDLDDETSSSSSEDETPTKI